MPWLEDLKFPRGYQMGTHKIFYIIRSKKLALLSFYQLYNYNINMIIIPYLFIVDNVNCNFSTSSSNILRKNEKSSCLNLMNVRTRKSSTSI